MRVFGTVWTRTRPVRIALAAGAVGGLLAGGVGSRIVMRFVAIVDGDSEGRLTDSHAVVGDVTLGGTLELLLFATIAGAFGGLLYLGVRRWIPVSHVPKGLVFGLAVMIVPGIIFFNPDNPDLQMFEPVLLFHALFIGIFLLYGTIVSGIAETLHPAIQSRRFLGSHRRAVAAEAVSLILLSSLHMLIAVSIQEQEGTCLVVDGSGGCAVRPQDGEVDN